MKIERLPLYVAKVKGSYLLDKERFWYLYNYHGEVLLDMGSYGEALDNTYLMPMEEWNDLGINDSNADFEKVEE